MNDVRNRFHVPDGAYLLSHAVGCQPKSAADVIDRHYLDAWAKDGGGAWETWRAATDGFNQRLATLLNGDATQFCPQVNLSSALTKIIHALPERTGRDTIVVSEQDFPTIAYVAEHAARASYRVRYVEKSRDVMDPGVWQEAIRDDVQLVCITHVLSNTGQRLPVEHIIACTRATGALSVVDVAQSIGVVPIDLSAWGADFVIGSCVKWLCGGPGAGFLWGSAAALSFSQPVDVGWFSHEDPFEFDIHEFRYAPGARRFWGGTPSVVPFVVANAGIDTMLDIGIDAIAAHNRTLVDTLIGNVPESMLLSPRDPERRGGTAVIRSADDAGLEAALTANGVHCDRRADGVRLSPHVYNGEDDVLAAADALRAFLG